MNDVISPNFGDLDERKPERRTLIKRIASWWFGPGTFERANVHIGANGVLSKRSEDILQSPEARKQLASFASMQSEKSSEEE